MTDATLHESIAGAWLALHLAYDAATDDEVQRSRKALQMLSDAPKYSEAYDKVLRRICATIAAPGAVGRLLAAHHELARYGQITPCFVLPEISAKRS